jgi:hypothetical protein
MVEPLFDDYTNAHVNFISAYLDLVLHLQDPDAAMVYDRFSTMFRYVLPKQSDHTSENQCE